MREVCKVLCVGVVSLVSAVLCPMTAHAGWPQDPNLNVPICSGTGAQFSPRIISDGAGSAIVTWEDHRGASPKIFAQRALANGAVDPAWPADGGALCNAAGSQYSPTVVSDGAGGAIIAWYEFRSGNYDIYAQHVLVSGAVDPAWPADGRALCIAASNQYAPTIASDGAGGAIVAWQDGRGGASWDIYAQHVLGGGAVDPAWPTDGRALCSATGPQSYPTMVSDGGGGAIVTWQDYRGEVSWDIYAQHVLGGGAVDPAWPTDGRALCTATDAQTSPTLASDGVGGAIVAWQDYRSGSYGIYAQHVLGAGAVDPAWPTDGRALCVTFSDQLAPAIVSDGAGGAIVTWQDLRSGESVSDIYAQHVLGGGAVDPAWPADGHALCTATGDQYSPRIVTDGAGGAIVSWQDYRGTSPDIYAQHVQGDGAVDSAWPMDGRAVCTATGDQAPPAVVSDGAGGAIMTWEDVRSGARDIYAQRVSRFGVLGSPDATITGVRDLQGDQGGKVRIAWAASCFDTLPGLGITAYGIWRRVSDGTAVAALRRGARLLTGAASSAEARPGVYRKAAAQAGSWYWEGVGSVLARGYATYTFVAPTFQDSTAAGNPYTVFMVDAHAAFAPEFWDSYPDSGYSVDNLAPGAPSGLMGAYGSGETHLLWDPSSERDIAGYRLYKGSSADFVPGPVNLIGATMDTRWIDPGMPGSCYKLSAVDAHGNESPYALLTPANIVGVGHEAVPRVLALTAPAPNPVGDATALLLSLPRDARVSLGVFDLQGRRVRSLLDKVIPAGDRRVTWNGRDDQGRQVSSGIYFLRLETMGRTIVRRVATVR